MTKGQTSKLDSQKKKKKGAAPAQRRQRDLRAGWIQGDFLPSTVTADDLLELVENGMIANKSWRLPAEGETEPVPQEGTDLLETFLGRRIQPLQARHYVGPEDSTRTHPECVTGEVVTAWVRGITGACDNPRGARRVKPFRADNPPPNEEWTNWYSPVSNGNSAEEEEGSQEGSMDSAEYVSDSGDTEEETEEEEGEVGE
ncbi:hypothetical protein ZWY2020_011015 [Hordeum vulgare]|nr:hypothetical protein ZWY2020_011015 [Hordeum vulgare]